MSTSHCICFCSPRPTFMLFHASGELEAFLLDLDCVLELRNTTAAHLAGDLGPKRPYDTKDVARVAGKARRILAFAAARGWPALARLVLPVALADGLSIQEAFAAGGARSVLHLAVRSRNSAMVRLAWRLGVTASSGGCTRHS